MQTNNHERCIVSLQRYLFILIGALILVFSAIQYYSIEQVRIQVNDEITNKTRTLSQLALTEFTERLPLKIATTSTLKNNPQANAGQNQVFSEVTLTEQIIGLDEYITPPQLKERDQSTPKIHIKIKIENTPNKEIQLDQDLVMITGDSTKTVTVSRTNTGYINNAAFTIPQDEKDALKQIKPGQIKAMFVNRVNAAYTVDFNFEDDEQNFQKIVSFDSDASSVNRYFSHLRWQLFAFTCVGLFFAFWLAKHISRPLSRLSQGFTDLGNGDLGIQLEKSGVKEMRDTIAIFNTTSERLNRLQKLEKNFQQQQQMAELGEVARGLAHTLRNPLNTIGLGISQMQEPDVSENEQALIAKKIQEKIVHLDGTIKTLMHLANADVDRSHKVNVVTVVSDIMLEVSVTSQARIKFSMALLDEPILLQCAEAEIRAIFHALISNAIEANEGQDMNHPVSVDLRQTEQGVSLCVRDYGNGVCADDLAHMFKPHFTTKAEGAGMGLFIVKRISEMYYKGRIELNNHEQGGCIATLQLLNAKKSENATNMTDIESAAPDEK